ncbi:MAG: rhodanese-like domain-containing protein [Candidatus Anaerobiospirillum merdipullorum]|uniref:Rhodanese-like domain-containing protein n=1 Tax=Candidatus Anaerobiospirillum merdipullorum TaxID=2838450 RepID=A0A9E2KMC6_9GAMM|nr:rhodanese-like domain-containing protein [Candidatus Anaerobiospirillum merdipullorum]
MFPSFGVSNNEDILTDFSLVPGMQTIAQNVANALIETHPEYSLIDVRTPEEFVLGHISLAHNVPLELIKRQPQAALLPGATLDTPILLYCRSGRRSLEAAHLLVKAGFKYVLDFGGVITWQYGLTAGPQP